MAIICPKFNLLYIMAPRTSCTAIGKVLCEELGGEYLPKADILNPDGYIAVQKKHSKLSELIDNNILSQEKADQLFKFTSIRNPFDSIVSLYFKKRYKYKDMLSDPESWPHRIPGYVEDMKFCNKHTFNAWILKFFGRKLIKYILGMGRTTMYNDFAEGVDAVIRFENIQHDFQGVLDEAGVENKLTIPVVNTTPSRKPGYRQYYSRLSRLLVEITLYHELKQNNYQY